MRKLVYYVGVTLDGRIAGPGGEYEFFPQGDEQRRVEYSAAMSAAYPETVPTAFREASGVAGLPNRHFDTVVMGLGTYRPGLDAGMPSPYAHLRQYVVSSTLDPATAGPEVTVVPGDPLGLVRRLKREEGGDGLGIWLCGGGKLAGAVLPEIDELVLKSYPVIAGAGIPLVGGGFDPVLFDPVQRTLFENGVCVTRFVRR
ncbi:dihydrofolate reductase family protein [Streptomyces sp. NPDC003691]